MSSTNQSPQYQKAESKFLGAQTDEERLTYLDEMIRECPKHKSSEKMLANLKTRYIKLKEKIESQKKSGKGSKKSGIKKEDIQAVIIGKTNSGKSSILSLLTNANPRISPGIHVSFTTKHPEVGISNISNCQIQLVENPAIFSEFYDRGIPHTADTILLVVNSIEEIPEILREVERHHAKKLIVFNKIDLLSPNEKRKLEATLKSKKYNFCLISCKTQEGIENLKNKLFQSFDKLRIFTKLPREQKSPRPIIMNPDSSVQDVAEKILKGFSNSIKETRIYGPSAKFLGQKVGLKHKLMDLDVVEFKTR